MNRLVQRLIAYFRVPRNAIVASIVLILLIASFVLPKEPPHVSLAAEQLVEGGPAWLTNSILTMIVVDIIILVLALWTRFSLKEIPQGIGNVMESLVEALYNLTQSVAGDRAPRFFRWVATIFFFVLISNYSGLLPGVGSIGIYHTGGDSHGESSESHGQVAPAGQVAMAKGLLLFTDRSAGVAAEEEGYAKFVPLFRSPSADLNMTFALAIITMVMVQFWGVRALGASYFAKFLDPKNFRRGFMGGINVYVGILELISEFAKIVSFAFRLFGNIFAGEVLLVVMAFLIPFLIPLPFYGLELFVGFIQALVFMMLAVVFFTTATISHGHDDHH